MKNIYTLVIAIGLFLTLGATSISAQTYVNQAASGANDGTTWANAYTDLTTALANTTTGEIWVVAGTYYPGQGSPDSSSTFRISNNISLYGGFDGTETTNGDQDPGANPTILSADINNDDIQNNFVDNKSDNVQHVIAVDSLLSPITIDGFDIVGGNTSFIEGQSEFFLRGGGIFAYSTINVSNVHFYNHSSTSGSCVYVSPNGGGGGGNSTFTNCEFTNSRGTIRSAGLYLNQIPDVTVTNCEFRDNQTTSGALYLFGSENLSVNNCTFDNNLGIEIDGFGGAVYMWRTANLSFTDCTFTNNRGGNGGAVFYNGVTLPIDPNNLVFENCSFFNNQATDFGGGAIYTFGASETINNCTFNNNMGPNGGGAFFAGTDFEKDIIVSNSSFIGGASAFGAAHNCYGSNSFYTLENNTYTTGVASSNAGAVIMGFQANVNVNNCSFEQNTAEFGGANSHQNDSTIVNYTNCFFQSNTSNGFGGAIAHSGGIFATIDQCEFVLNTAAETGGAIHATPRFDDLLEGNISISNSIFNFNGATNQAGALNLNNIDADVSNSLFINNAVSPEGAAGGAISMNASDTIDVTVNLINSTFSSNTAPIGSGVATFTTDNESFLTLNVQNNLFFEAENNYQVEGGSPLVNSTGGNISNDASAIGVFDDASDQHEIPEPFFKNVGEFDYHLTAASPAVDAGIDTNAPLFDLDGNPRIGAVDAGAYEFDPATGISTILADNSTLAILPNPVDQVLNFELNNEWTGDLTIFIYNSNGQLINQWTATKGGTVFTAIKSVSKLTAGSYRLFVKYDRSVVTQQFVKL